MQGSSVYREPAGSIEPAICGNGGKYTGCGSACPRFVEHNSDHLIAIVALETTSMHTSQGNHQSTQSLHTPKGSHDFLKNTKTFTAISCSLRSIL